MWNLVSWNPTVKESGLLSKVVPIHEHSIYVDPLASIFIRVTCQELGHGVWTLFVLHALYSLIT